jgi:hypothetical protein
MKYPIVGNSWSGMTVGMSEPVPSWPPKAIPDQFHCVSVRNIRKIKKTILFVVLAVLTVNFSAPRCCATSMTAASNEVLSILSSWDNGGPDGYGTYRGAAAGTVVTAIQSVWAEHYAEAIKVSPPTGGVILNYLKGFFVSAPVQTYDTLTSSELTFAFYNLNTMQPMPPGSEPAIGSVVYEECTDFTTGSWTPIGSSTDAATDFALPVEFGDAVYAIEAVPFDTSGAPIVFTDPFPGGGNDAIGNLDFIPVPDQTSTIALLGISLSLVGFAGRRRMAKA